MRKFRWPVTIILGTFLCGICSWIGDFLQDGPVRLLAPWYDLMGIYFSLAGDGSSREDVLGGVAAVLCILLMVFLVYFAVYMFITETNEEDEPS